MLSHDVDNENFLLDGIFVTQSARNSGIGQKLLSAVRREAAIRGYATVRLDVADSNERAKALYEREGFVESSFEKAVLLSPFFGFKRVTKMIGPALFEDTRNQAACSN